MAMMGYIHECTVTQSSYPAVCTNAQLKNPRSTARCTGDAMQWDRSCGCMQGTVDVERGRWSGSSLFFVGYEAWGFGCGWRIIY